jgi:hypothetical protein
MVNIDVQAVAGTPEITPEEERLKPVGKAPVLSDQMIGPEVNCWPTKPRTCEYGVPVNPSGRYVLMVKHVGWAQAAQLKTRRTATRRTGFIVKYLRLASAATLDVYREGNCPAMAGRS